MLGCPLSLGTYAYKLNYKEVKYYQLLHSQGVRKKYLVIGDCEPEHI
jgi:hypothetical protein